MTKFDALWFHEWDAPEDINDVPRTRSKDQLYVHYNLEPPTRRMHAERKPIQKSHKYKKDFFNVSMSYRRDADLYCPYGSIVPRNKTISSLSHYQLKRLIEDFGARNQHLAQKSSVSQSGSVVTQFVSNCKSDSGR